MLRNCQFTQRAVIQITRQPRLALDQTFDRSLRITHNDYIVDSFGRRNARIDRGLTKGISRKAEVRNMAATICQKLADTDRTRHYSVPAVGRITVAIDLFLTPKAAANSDPFQGD